MTIDTTRLGMSVGHPGIDPRIWVAWAIVDTIRVDAAGITADVTVCDTGSQATVGCASQAGRGYGLYVPIAVGDVVVVNFNGATGVGQIVGALWDRGSPPPAVVVDHPEDAALVGPPGRRLRILSLDDGADPGSVVIGAGTGPVLLGDEGAGLGVARLGDEVQVTIQPGSVLVENLVPPFTPPYIPNPLPIVLSGTIVTASAKVRSS